MFSNILYLIFGRLFSDFKWFRKFIGGKWLKVTMINQDFGEFWLKGESELFDEKTMKILDTKNF